MDILGLHFSADRLIKREVEDKTEYKDRQIDGWKNQLAVFSLKIFFFEKDSFLPVKIQSSRQDEARAKNVDEACEKTVEKYFL